jgi:Skp family chaperone for outer membrane proteins
MNFAKVALTILFLVAAFLTGCTQSKDGDALPVVVIDLEAIASAIGQDVVIQEQMIAAREELNSQLTEMAADLEAMLEAEQAKLDAAPGPAQQEAFEQIQLEAQQKFAQAQAEAQLEAQRYQAGLVNEFHQQVKPVAAQVSAKYGARITLLADPSALWFDDSADITEEIIAILQAQIEDGPVEASEDSDSGEDSDGESASN